MLESNLTSKEDARLNKVYSELIDSKTEFSKLVQKKCEELGRELIPKELFEVFSENYLEVHQKYALTKRKIYEESENGKDYVHFKGKMTINGADEVTLSGVGNGPIDAFFNAIKKFGLDKYEFISYSQHAISQGSDSKAVSYIEQNWEPENTVKLSGKIRYGSETVEVTSADVTAFGEAPTKVRTRNIHEFVVTAGSAPYDEDSAYNIDEVAPALNEKKRVTEERLKNTQTAAPKANANRLSRGF